MPRQLKFKPSPYVAANGCSMFRLIIPARFSTTGKRKAIYYKTKAEAEADAAVLRESMRQGTLGLMRMLTPEQARQAAEAVEKLSAARMSIAEAVEIAINHRAAVARSVSISELFARYENEVGSARQWSVATRQAWRKFARPLLEKNGGSQLAAITPENMRSWLEDAFGTVSMFNAACRTLSGAFTWAVKQGLAASNVFERIERKAARRGDDVDVFTPSEARALLDACRDYTTEGGLDCRDCKLAFAFLLFTGVRPFEFTRLRWEDLKPQPDGSLMLFVGSSKAKTRTARFIRIRPNMQAFIDAWSGPRTGKLAPANWARKAKLVRARAGFSSRKDTARHSFASYLLAAGETTEAVKADLGHTRASNVLFVHYRAAATPAAAAEYWSISPLKQKPRCASNTQRGRLKR